MTPITRSFFAQAERTPARVAVRDGSESMTFAELARWVDSFAGALADHGAGPDRIVACVLSRTARAIAARLAVLHAGAAYLAIDPRDPRIETIIEDARPVRVITDRDMPATDASPEGPSGPRRSPSAHADPPGDQAAYVVYTSGSAGRPKGVVVEHHSLANLFTEHRRTLFPQAPAGPLTVAHTMAFSFDAAWDPVLWMVGGHELVVVPDEARGDPRAILQLGADVLEVTPLLAARLADAGMLDGPSAPAVLLVGGEPVGEKLWRRLRAAPRTVAVNLYGPSECTVFATRAFVSEHPAPTIGRPILGTRATVIDPAGRPVPAGTSGELMIGGAAVARGYLGDAPLTAERFTRSGFRTGDRVRETADGSLEFLGRTDLQLQIRGHRVEPGEVEAALTGLPCVEHAVVAPVRRPNGQSCLAAYLVADPAPTPSEVRLALAAQLPGYMIPVGFHLLDHLPMTAHGKVDRAALPPPDFSRPPLATAFTPPAPGPEREIAAVWADLLGIDEIGAHDDFGDLGGDSLLAAEAAERLSAAGLDCGLGDVLANPTVAALAARLSHRLMAADSHGGQ